MPSSHLILCRPLLLLSPIPPSIRVFSSESTLHMRWPKYCSFSFSISPSNEHPGLISFRMDWLDLLAVQGTLQSLLQHLSLGVSKSVKCLRCATPLVHAVALSHSVDGPEVESDFSSAPGHSRFSAILLTPQISQSLS